MLSIPIRPAAALLAATSLLGCTSPPAKPSRSVLAGNPAHTLLILPLNLTIEMPAELQGMSPVVWKQLELYLRAHGKKLKTVAQPVARRLWIESISQARAGKSSAKVDFDDAARLLVLELARHADFDMVIVPSLFVQQARLLGRVARWDGAKRQVEFEAYGREARKLAANPSVEGTAPAASLHVVVLDNGGEVLQQAQGGLELLVRVVIRANDDLPEAPPKYAYATRTDLFADPQPLREGIARALSPFLPPLPPSVALPPGTAAQPGSGPQLP